MSRVPQGFRWTHEVVRWLQWLEFQPQKTATDPKIFTKIAPAGTGVDDEFPGLVVGVYYSHTVDTVALTTIFFAIIILSKISDHSKNQPLCWDVLEVGD